MVRLPEDDKKIDHSETPATALSGQPFTSGPSNTLSNNSLNSQLEDAESDHLLIDFRNAPQNNLGPPPDFTQYEAEYFEVGYSDIVSHDPHLNADGSFFTIII